MFIKEIKTRNKKTGAEYIKHALVESVRTDKGPRQRTIMQLGHLKLGKKYWPQLIAELECRISWQPTLEISGAKISTAVKSTANTAMDYLTIPHRERETYCR